jgi:3-hydroxyisobutyrate dehydrogenase
VSAASAIQVGFVGLGDIGTPMSIRLARAFPLRVWARRIEATRPVVAAGATGVDQLVELASCDVIGICVSDDDAVRDVTEGLAPSLRPGTVVCLHSTVAPETAVAVAARMCDAGVGLVDAPVSGGYDGAAAGRLQVFVGGDAAHIERCSDVLERLGTVRVMGAVGAGQLTKLLNNALYAAQLGLARAALDAAVDQGLDPHVVVDALLGGSGSSFALARLARVTHPSRVDHVVWLLDKDVALFERGAPPAAREVTNAARRFVDSLLPAEAHR